MSLLNSYTRITAKDIAVMLFIFAVGLTFSPPAVLAAPNCTPSETNTNPVTRLDVKIFHYHSCPNSPGVDWSGLDPSGLEVGCKIVLDATGKDSQGTPTAYVGDPSFSCQPPGLVGINENCMNPRLDALAPGTVTCTGTVDGVSGQVTFTIKPSVSVPPIPTPGDEFPPTEPPPSATFGPEPSSLAEPTVNDTGVLLDSYCAVGNLCICGSQVDQDCTQTAYCVLNPGACRRVPYNECQAAPATASDTTVPTPILTDFGVLIGELFTWSLSILGLALFVIILYAGFEWLTAAGDPGRIGRARSRIRNAILGAILLLSSYIILTLINPDLVGGGFNLPVFSPIRQQGPVVTPVPFQVC